MTAVAAITAYSGWVRNEPMSTRNSPTNPFVPGTPIELRQTMVSNVANTGITFAMPP